MARLLKTFTDARLRFKMGVLRGVCLVLLAAWLAALLWVAASGRFVVTNTRSGSKYGSPSVTQTIVWADSPLAYVFNVAWYFVIGAGFIAALYLVLSRLIERYHGRSLPFFRRKYPH